MTAMTAVSYTDMSRHSCHSRHSVRKTVFPPVLGALSPCVRFSEPGGESTRARDKNPVNRRVSENSVLRRDFVLSFAESKHRIRLVVSALPMHITGQKPGPTYDLRTMEERL